MAGPSGIASGGARARGNLVPALAAAIVLLALGAGLLLGATSASGRSATVLGNVGDRAPAPSCPTPKEQPFPDRKLCLTYASVTGFQVRANGERGVFKVPRDGAIVAWSVDLSRPRKSERETFSGLFEGGPSARLAVLKRSKGGKFKLTRQSPVLSLDPYYGEKPIFTLGKPLRVKKGRVVALTTASWIPNFAHDGRLGLSGDKWRASRRSARCGDDPDKSSTENREDLLASKPHQSEGTVRGYGCSYGKARVLYWAYFVPARKR